MRVKTFALVIAVMLTTSIGCQPQHRKRTPEQEQAAVDFSFEGVGFSTTLAEFKRQHPNAKDFPEGATSPGEVALKWKPRNARLAFVEFLDGSLVSMSICYDVENGAQFVAIQDKLCDKIGLPDKYKDQETFWYFQEDTHRVITMGHSMQRSVSLNVFNLELLGKGRDREARASAHFSSEISVFPTRNHRSNRLVFACLGCYP